MLVGEDGLATVLTMIQQLNEVITADNFNAVVQTCTESLIELYEQKQADFQSFFCSHICGGFEPRHKAYERSYHYEMKLLVTRIGDDPIPSGSKPDILPTQTHGYHRGDFPFPSVSIILLLVTFVNTFPIYFYILTIYPPYRHIPYTNFLCHKIPCVTVHDIMVLIYRYGLIQFLLSSEPIFYPLNFPITRSRLRKMLWYINFR